VSEPIRLTTPLTQDKVRSLHIGDRVLISGTIYAARDAAHKRLTEALDRGEKLPVDLRGQVVYYVGPSPAKPGQAIGAAGPTTSGRMDAYTPRLIAEGLRGMIGKGYRKPEVVEAMKKYGVPYLAAVGGAGALISQSIKKYTVLAGSRPGGRCRHGSRGLPGHRRYRQHRRQLLRDRTGSLQGDLALPFSPACSHSCRAKRSSHDIFFP